MPSKTWAPEDDRTILITLLETQNIPLNTALLTVLAERLSTDTIPVTAEAVKHRIRNLKKMAQESGGSNPGAEGKPKATSRKKKAGDDADGESPSKKRKTSAKRGKGGKAVAEEEDDNDDDYEEGGVKEGIKKEQIDGDD